MQETAATSKSEKIMNFVAGQVRMHIPTLVRRALVLALCAFASSSAIAGDVATEPDRLTWSAGIDGPVIEWNSDGSVRRISSRHSQPVQMPDRRGIRKAQVVAEEKAKAAIMRFMDQTSFGSRSVVEIDNDLETATRERSPAVERWSKVGTRTLVENLTEVVGSFAKGQKSGIMVLERGYNPDAEEAWVVVGWSQKSLDAAGQIQEMEDRSAQRPRSGPPCTSKDDGPCDPTFTQPGEVERLNDPDW